MNILKSNKKIPILEVKNFSYFFSNNPTQPVVKNVSFSIEPNEFLAIIGESGSGKSVTAKAILQLNSSGGDFFPESEILYANKNLLTVDQQTIRNIRGKEIGIVFQDPMIYLNPTATIGSQIEESLKYHFPHYTPLESYNRTLELLKLVELPNQKAIFKRYPHELSGGMRQRVMIAISHAPKPRIFIADEITTALDVTLQREILLLLKKLQKDIAMSILFISHDLSIVSSFASNIMVMHQGRMVEYGSVETICKNPSHPYTKALINSIPNFSSTRNRLETMQVLRKQTNKGCLFYSKCKFSKPICDVKCPTLQKEGGANVLCHFPIKNAAKEEKACLTPLS